MICTESHGGRSKRPHTHFDASGLPVRPASFAEWWQWAVDQADASRRELPPKIHQRDYPPDDHPGRWRVARRQQNVVAAPPFTPRFVAYVDGRKARSSFRRVLARMAGRNRGRAAERESHEVRILFALEAGYQSADDVRALIGGCREDFFHDAAMRAFRVLWDETVKNLTPMGVAAHNMGPEGSLPPTTSSASGTGEPLNTPNPNREPPLCDCHSDLHGRSPKRAA